MHFSIYKVMMMKVSISKGCYKTFMDLPPCFSMVGCRIEALFLSMQFTEGLLSFLLPFCDQWQKISGYFAKLKEETHNIGTWGPPPATGIHTHSTDTQTHTQVHRHTHIDRHMTQRHRHTCTHTAFINMKC